jgi:hypothetical protein
MCVCASVDRGGDGDAPDEVVVVILGHRHREDRLGVRAHELAQARGDPRERAAQAAALEQPVRPQRSGGHHDPARAVHAAILAQPRARAHAFDLVALRAVGRAERADIAHGAFWHHMGAELLGEVEVVLDERVLGPVRAAHHAATAQAAAGSVGPRSAEERVRDGLSGLAEEHADGRLLVAVGHAELLAELAQEQIGGVIVRVLNDAEHPLGLGVVRRERGLPVLEARPLAILEERLRRHVQGVREAEAPAADTAAGHHRDMPERGETEDALHPEHRLPEVALQIGGGARQLIVCEAPPALQHAHRMAFLG